MAASASTPLVKQRPFNFNAGPAALPLSVLQQAQSEFLDYAGSGMSVMEMSHRSVHFEKIMAEAEADCRKILSAHTHMQTDTVIAAQERSTR